MEQSVTTATFERYAERISSGEALAPDEIRELASTPDILPLGMLADTLRRRLHGTRATFVRVAVCQFDKSFADAVPPAAREIQIAGEPESLSVAAAAVSSAKAIAGARVVSGFSWSDVERLRHGRGETLGSVLRALREAGLDALAYVPIDHEDIAHAVESLSEAGFSRLRLTVAKAPASVRVDLLLAAAGLQERYECVQAINPLPMTVTTFRPTTGYEDVKMVAIARLAAPNVATIQVDWPRYGPKLAQVALTFGADDIYGVSASDEAPEGRRRAPLEEIRRNIQAAGFEAAERDGTYTVVS